MKTLTTLRFYNSHHGIATSLHRKISAEMVLHVSRMFQDRPANKLYLAKVNTKKAVGRPRTRGRDYIEDLGWNCSGFNQDISPNLDIRSRERQSVEADRKAWWYNIELLSP